MFVNSDGDLILGASGDDFEILVNTDNYLQDPETPFSIVHQVGTGLGYSPAGLIESSEFIFTLTNKALVEVNYSVSWSIYKVQHNKDKRVADRRAKIVQTGVYFRSVNNGDYGDALIFDGNGDYINGLGPNSDETWCIDQNLVANNCREEGGLIAINRQFYNNSSLLHGAYQDFKNTASDYVILGPGTYVVLFAGRMEVNDVTATGAERFYMGSGMDEVQIIAYYYSD